MIGTLLHLPLQSRGLTKISYDCMKIYCKNYVLCTPLIMIYLTIQGAPNLHIIELRPTDVFHLK